MKRASIPRAGLTSFLSLACVILLGSCSSLDTTEVRSLPGTTTTIIMVRHADRDDGYDPPLNDTGWIRAEVLADELEDAGITMIFYPDFIRNRQTAEPLLERIEADVRVYSQTESGITKQLANDFVSEVVAQHSGEVVLWIGNTGPEIEGVQSGNLQEIYARLGGTGAPPILYTSLYTIVLHDDGPPTITEGHYFIPEQD